MTGGDKMDRMIRKAQRMEKRVEDVKKKLGKRVFQGTAGGDQVTVQMNGEHQVQSVRIDPAVIDPADPELLERLVLDAVNDAVGVAKLISDREMKRATKGFAVPGM